MTSPSWCLLKCLPTLLVTTASPASLLLIGFSDSVPPGVVLPTPTGPPPTGFSVSDPPGVELPMPTGPEGDG